MAARGTSSREGQGDMKGEIMSALSLMKELSASTSSVWGKFNSANTAGGLVFGL
jgi:hypothetical protein